MNIYRQEAEGLHLVQESQGEVRQYWIETLKTRLSLSGVEEIVADGLLLNKLMRTVTELKIPQNYENIVNQILQIKTHKTTLIQFNINSIYIVLRPP